MGTNASFGGKGANNEFRSFEETFYDSIVG